MATVLNKHPLSGLKVTPSGIILEGITEQDYQDSAKLLKCEEAAIKAVAMVESGGSGFMANGDLKILFEPHVMWRQLKKHGINPEEYLKEHPEFSDVLYEKWDRSKYGPASIQWDKLRKAMKIHPNAAYEATSFGKFQILGMHYEACGYRNIFEMIHFLGKGEKYHLKAFVSFLLNTGLAFYLRKKLWTPFAEKYNGKGFRNHPSTHKDDYDFLIKSRYERLKLLEAKPPKAPKVFSN